MGIMSDPAFPAPAIGTVHLENSITAAPPDRRSARPSGVTASVGPARPHPKGTVYDFVTVVTADGETVWEETSTYLRRGKGDESASSGSGLPGRRAATASSGGCPATSAGSTPPCRATTTRSTSTR